jgi:inorganic pyrophosphatase
MKRRPCLSRLPTFDEDDEALQVVIETPRGSHNKYDYNPGSDCFELAKVLPEGMTFPYDFGLIPSTLGDDGDPLDILVLLDFPVIAGCLLKVRLIGAIQAKQKDKGESWERNDRLIAVAEHAHSHENINQLHDLQPRLLQELKDFFVEYNKLDGKKFKPLRDCGAKHATKLVRRGIRKFKKAA